MAGFLLHVNATVSCPHGGRATASPSQQRALGSGQPVSVLPDVWTVTGCAFTVGGKPQPCVTVRWTSAAARVRAGGQPVLTQGSAGLCQSAEQAPQGPALVVVLQERVAGS